jgi:predicted ATPase
VGGVFHLPLFLGWLSTAFVKLGKVEDGLKQHSAALTLSTQTGVRCYEAELHKIKGEFLLVGCDDAAAEVQFGDAIISARHQEAKLFELRASVGLARLWIRQGKLAEARDLLAPVYAWFTEGFDMPDLQKARELLVT